MSQDYLGLFDTPPDKRQVRLAFAVVGLLVIALLVIFPVRDVRIGEISAFIPTVNAVISVSDLIVCAMLYAQAGVFRSRALVVLASSYLASALLVVAYVLTFPGAFSQNGLLGAGASTTAWLAFARLWAFPIAVIPYVLLKSADSAAPSDVERAPVRVMPGLLGAIALAALVTVLTTLGHDALPPLFADRRATIYPNILPVTAGTIALTFVAMITLFLKRASVLDMWLLVALSAWLVEQVLNLPLHERFTVGWYCLTGMILTANLVVMLALIAESNRLYARLALSAAARARERDSRLMSMEAVAAAIAHEVGQPLTAVTLSARAGLTWLTRTPPAPEKAIKSLRDTLDAGQRSFDVIKSVRANFGQAPRAFSQFSLNDLASETVLLLDGELAAQKVVLQVTLDETLPPILANRVQIQRVLINLLTNAIESLSETRYRQRRIAVRSKRLDGHDVLFEVSDNGSGIAPDKLAQIFDPFFTTKSTGTGLGLSLSRTIVEEHGGRLWASPNPDGGATFHLQMPAMAAAHALAT